MAIKRVVSVDFWNDNKVIDLFSPEDKYFMLYLLTNPHTTQLGIYKLNFKKAAFELGHSPESVKVLIDRFETKYNIIKYSTETGEVAIKNFLRHSILTGGKPVEDLLTKEIEAVDDKSLIAYVFNSIKGKTGLNETVRKVIMNNDYYNENEKQNDNQNDNDNEKSYPHSCNDSSETPKTPTKHIYGEYKHVRLTDEEFNRLEQENGLEITLKAITALDEYMELSGKSYKNHNLAIRKWALDKAKGNQQQYGKPKEETDPIKQFAAMHGITM